MKDINLKEQLTEQLKNTWYYQQIKWGLTINKNSVSFDHDFTFKIRKCTFESETWYQIGFYIDNEFDHYISGCYAFNDRYLDNPAEMLENILLYIANRI